MSADDPEGVPRQDSANREAWKSQYMSIRFMLIRRREALGLTQADVAAKIGMPLRTYQRKEASLTDFTALEFFYLAGVLGVSLTAEIKDQST